MPLCRPGWSCPRWRPSARSAAPSRATTAPRWTPLRAVQPSRRLDSSMCEERPVKKTRTRMSSRSLHLPILGRFFRSPAGQSFRALCTDHTTHLLLHSRQGYAGRPQTAFEREGEREQVEGRFILYRYDIFYLFDRSVVRTLSKTIGYFCQNVFHVHWLFLSAFPCR